MGLDKLYSVRNGKDERNMVKEIRLVNVDPLVPDEVITDHYMISEVNGSDNPDSAMITTSRLSNCTLLDLREITMAGISDFLDEVAISIKENGGCSIDMIPPIESILAGIKSTITDVIVRHFNDNPSN
jgi:hypothetical protein